MLRRWPKASIASVIADLVAALVDAGVVTAMTAARRRTRSASIRIHGRGPLSDLLASALRCSGARIKHSSQRHAGVTAETTDLVVLSDSLVADPRMVRELHAARIPHLPVRVRDGTGLVGPLVLPGVTSCLRCADLHRSDRDAAWPAVAAQLRDTVGSADRATVLATAALALNQVDRVIAAVRGGVNRSRPAATADAGHHAGVRRRHRLDRGPPVDTASPMHARADNACCHVDRPSAPSGMMVWWQTSNGAAPLATRSWRASPSAWPAGPRSGSASG